MSAEQSGPTNFVKPPGPTETAEHWRRAVAGSIDPAIFEATKCVWAALGSVVSAACDVYCRAHNPGEEPPRADTAVAEPA